MAEKYLTNQVWEGLHPGLGQINKALHGIISSSSLTNQWDTYQVWSSLL